MLSSAPVVPTAPPAGAPASKGLLSKVMTIEVVVPVVVGGLLLCAVVGIIVALQVKKSDAAALVIAGGGVNGEGDDYARMGDTVGDAADPYA